MATHDGLNLTQYSAVSHFKEEFLEQWGFAVEVDEVIRLPRDPARGYEGHEVWLTGDNGGPGEHEECIHVTLDGRTVEV